MSTILAKTFNGRLIRIRQSDRYVSGTDMAKASGKLLGHWNVLKSTNEYLFILERSIGIPIDQLVEINESTGLNETRGTWLHPKVALRFAQWCSAEFAVQVDCWIDELLTTGKVELQPSDELKCLQITDSILDKKLKVLELQNTMLTLHGASIVLTLEGKQDQIVEVEKKTIEVIDDRHNIKFRGQTLAQLKDHCNKTYGTKFKSGADLKRYLEAHGKGDVIAQTLRSITADYVPEESLGEVMKFLGGARQQKLLGED